MCMSYPSTAVAAVAAAAATAATCCRVYVSNFARDLLARIHREPVFNVLNINKDIYNMVPVMSQAKVRGCGRVVMVTS